MIGKIAGKIVSRLKKDSDGFLYGISGVVHVGANIGQERDTYSRYGLKVLWIEPVPEVFEELSNNIVNISNQQAFLALITDKDNVEYEFHVASNNGASSSILKLQQHQDIWPEVTFTRTIYLRSLTLASLFERERIDACEYQALIIDTQGSELLVLKGSLPLLTNFKYIKTEVADFESYKGCCKLSDISNFMSEHGYKECLRTKFAERTEGGSYFDVLFEKLD